MNRILIGALSGWQHVDRRDRCASTWFRDARELGHDAVFLLGIHNLLRPERHGDLLLLPCPDDYDSLPQRTRWFCRWALECDDWDYLFKCDDDTYVCARRLAEYDLGGREYVGAEWSPGVDYGSGGAGYFLSRDAAKIVAERLQTPTGAEDVLVGKLLGQAGMPLSIEKRLVPFGNLERRPRHDNDLLTLHGVTADLFFASHAEVGGGRETGPLPHSTPPYLFAERYGGVFQKAGWSVDPRHIYWIHELLMAWPFRRTLEIGSLHGASSTAFVEALNRGRMIEAHFCDLEFTPSFQTVVTNCFYPGNVQCHERPSWEVLTEHGPFDFVFLDGDHRLACVQREVELLLAQKTTCVMAHDTTAQGLRYFDCEGSAYLKRAIQAEAGYFCLEDSALRDNEITERGMFFATRDLELLEAARRLFRRWCAEDTA